MFIFNQSNNIFNLKDPQFLHIDVNSCFATIEQQYNPKFRNRPIAVAADISNASCVIAPSIEAKKLGIKVGFRVGEAKRVCPNIIILPPDSDKYRYVHECLKELLEQYTPYVVPKSIDEFSLDFSNFYFPPNFDLLAKEIKSRIRQEVGDYISVSIGYSTNASLAKIAAGMIKPDGLVSITKDNFLEQYSKLRLKDLTGISNNNELRLKLAGINSVLDFYHAPHSQIFQAFHSLAAGDWYTILRGYSPRTIISRRYSVSHSHVLAKPLFLPEVSPLLHKFTHKLALRLKKLEVQTQSINLYFRFTDHTSWTNHHPLSSPTNLRRIIYYHTNYLKQFAPNKPIRQVGLNCSHLISSSDLQLSLFDNQTKFADFEDVSDRINKRFGTFTAFNASLANDKHLAPDRIAFGKVEEI